MSDNRNFFRQALPVWLNGEEKEMNICCEFVFKADYIEKPALNITGATFYQIFTDGELIHFGPARKALGYTAVDEIKFEKPLKDTEIVIRAIGYNCGSFNGVNIPSFIQAEVYDGESIVAATGRSGFKYYKTHSHLQKVARYSTQRQFSECWDFNRLSEEHDIAVVDAPENYCQRGVLYPTFVQRSAKLEKSEKYIDTDELRMPIFDYLIETPHKLATYKYDEFESKPLAEYLGSKITDDGEKLIETWNFAEIEAGFFRIEMEAKTDGKIILAFAEQLDTYGRPNLKCVDSSNVIPVSVPKGSYIFYSLEPYTAMHTEILHAEGDIEIKSVSIKELAYPEEKIIPFKTDDEELMLIYNAAVKTFRQNSVDIFTDCPSRERAGWLFDSFYTAKAEYDLTGQSLVEKAFLENYLNGGTKKDRGGVTDMCYPADVYSGTVVPQWSLWYIQQIYDYLANRSSMDEKAAYEKQLFDILNYFTAYENEYELLEKLEGWNFVEWSALNHRVWDVSWPTNMLYADTLEKMGIMYERQDLLEKAKRIRATILKMAFDGKLFHDRAMRNRDGLLENTNEFSETTQYYALFFGMTDDDAKFDLIQSILLGKVRIEDISGYGAIEPSDAMPGLYMKIDLLLQLKEFKLVIQNIREYFGDMARITGTLWERKNGITSRNHGFASFVAVAIKEAERAEKG